MIKFVARLVLFPLQLLAFAGILFLAVLWLQSKTIDGAEIRATLLDTLSRTTGQAARLGGVKVTFSWPPRIVLHDLRIPNVSAGGSMLRVARVEAELDPYRLVIGGRKIRVTRFINPEILVERDRRGRMNWAGGAAGLARALTRAAEIIGSKRVVIAGGRIVVRDRRRGSTTVIDLGRVELQGGAPAGCDCRAQR